MEDVMEKMTIEKYAAYKDSGVEWLGEIPDHWEALSNKFIFRLKKVQVGKRSNEYVLLSLTLNGIIKRDMENPQGKFPAEFDTYQEVKKGDFVFCLFDVEETPRAVGLSPFDGMITGAYTVMEPNNGFDRGFLYYFYLNLDADKRMKPLYKGLRNVIPKETFFSFKTFVPPLDEQTSIASFLDRKTAQIEKAIAQKEALIELLKERRQILIHKAVTRGLDPNVKMKDSGVEWIGEIPEHWEVKPLGFSGKTQNGISKGADYFGSGFPFLSYGDVYKNIELPKHVDGLAESSDADRKQYSVIEGDVLFTRTSETVEEIGFASTCTCTILNATFSGFLIRFRPNRNILDKYFSKYYFSSKTHRAFFVKEMNLVIRASLSQELLKKMPILIPSKDEQVEIGNYLENVSTKTFAAIVMKEKEIEKLKEYKATLINAGVTGKIKVA
ncbi:restriction endonuclease subunit S [Flavisolibacter ginsenosidimutans]|uniref:Restriction endonuclease subunit S n=1 Tax=Flavisolibacter ginsenosidimutans TaxID=661481 RepID=A0A5B8UJQ7_9BACT|nr:restriction endonuclease subunit S [Flavisolibacter ginsenosidimutans]QEC56632.1 restriction endonuclease subunit S [Flavisolibacter ginsenosidimutans]